MRDKRRNLDWVELGKNQTFAVGYLDADSIYVEDEYTTIEEIKERILNMKEGWGFSDNEISVSVIEELKWDV